MVSARALGLQPEIRGAQMGRQTKSEVPMPRLLIATTVPETLARFLVPFAEHFRGRGWRVDAMANGVSSSPECVKTFDHVWDMPWSRNPLAPRNFISAPKQVREIVTREGYDLVHVHTPVAAFVTRMALRRMRQE